MENRMLFFLNPEVPWQRTLRRIIVVGFLGFIVLGIEALLAGEFGFAIPVYLAPILTAILAGIDKWIREAQAIKAAMGK